VSLAKGLVGLLLITSASAAFKPRWKTRRKGIRNYAWTAGLGLNGKTEERISSAFAELHAREFKFVMVTSLLIAIIHMRYISRLRNKDQPSSPTIQLKGSAAMKECLVRQVIE